MSDSATNDKLWLEEAQDVKVLDESEAKAGRRQSKMVIPLLISVFMSMFLVALDRTIISTAIPQITDEFKSLDDVGWYGSAYLLTCCAFQLLFGKLYTLYSVRVVFLTNILLFEIASAICGAAPTSVAFVVGRAMSGIGAAGIFAGTAVCIIHVVPLDKRPQIQGIFGALFGLASIVGPLVGGAFTSNITWRWCFYINLPIGAVAMSVIYFCLKVPNQDATQLGWADKLSQLDALGTVLLLPGVICLLLALQWGGQTFAWNNVRIIALLTLMGALFVLFVSVQILRPKTAMIPRRVFKQRSIVAGLWSTVCIGASQYIYVYFLSIWFQCIKGVSAVNSGICLLPLMLSMVVGSLLGGITTSKLGYYTPCGIVGSCIMSVGAGLLMTLQVDARKATWIGYQILYGFGMGLAFQVPNLATQAVLPTTDVPIGIALMFFGQLLGAAVFVAVGENVLSNQLLNRLSEFPEFDSSLVTSGGAISLIDSLPASLRETAIAAYNQSLQDVFQIGLILACLSICGAGTLEWRSIHKK